ncbi:MAG: class I SAM-dependent methyltransferase [Methylobacteriaceae bacterium]|jgi:SAM-dependent methyltransferase|nr:class I SAM-dependent methyltransferase [Methylobacteriaceae bacterium]
MTDNNGKTAPAFPMTWEQAVEWLRSQPDRQELVRSCYFDDPLEAAAARFHDSEEWAATRKLIPATPGTVLDIGAGRGISSYALARDGWRVTALEPDPSALVGAGAIETLKTASGLPIEIVGEWGEALPFPDARFDLIHCRQVLHHALNLETFLKEAARVLKPGGWFIATREHVADTPEGLAVFLRYHDLHRFYGGENAFPLSTYLAAVDNAGLEFTGILTPFDSPVNYFPATPDEIINTMKTLWHWKHEPAGAELAANARKSYTIPGRLYTFTARKPSSDTREDLTGPALSHRLMVQALTDNYESRLRSLEARLVENERKFDLQLAALRQDLAHPWSTMTRHLRSKLSQ